MREVEFRISDIDLRTGERAAYLSIVIIRPVNARERKVMTWADLPPVAESLWDNDVEKSRER